MLKDLLKQLTISALMLVIGPPQALAQREIIRDMGTQYAVVPAKEPGNHLIFGPDATVYHTEKDFSHLRKATKQEFSTPKDSWKYLLRGYLFTEMPSGALIWRKTKGLFYRQERIDQPLKVVCRTPADFNKLDDGGDSPYFQFVTEHTGFVHMDNSTKVFRTRTGGTTWEPMGDLSAVGSGPGVKGVIRDMHFINETTGFAWIEIHESEPYTEVSVNEFIGNRVVRTEDAGRTWRAVKMGGAYDSRYMLGDIYWHSVDGENKVSMYAYGDSVIYDSQDGGKTFVMRQIVSKKQHWNRKLGSAPSLFIDTVNFKPFQVFFIHLTPGDKI